MTFISYPKDANGNVLTSLGTRLAGEDPTSDVVKVEDRSVATNVTASQVIKVGAGRLKGLFVSTANTTPTIKFWNGTSAAGSVLLNTFTPVAGTMYNFPGVEFNTGLYITIAGTVDCTVYWNA